MLENIIESCKYVSINSKHVSINEEKLNQFIEKIENIKMEHWLSSSPFGLLELPVETIINFLLIYESIDFSFWGSPKWSIETDSDKLDGSIALLYALLKYVKKSKTTDLSNVSQECFSNILKGNIKIPLLEERFKIIKEISTIVNEKMQGNFYQYIKHITSDAELFETIIKYFPSFKDERTYNNQTIYFYKLAQLLTSDILHIREQKEKIEVDYTHLVGCADYKIPQILRGIGILNYDDELSKIVDNQIEIPTNSIYEVEIRANMLTVIDMINQKLNHKYSSIDINDYLFMQKKNKNLTLKPYHLTRCTNY